MSPIEEKKKKKQGGKGRTSDRPTGFFKHLKTPALGQRGGHPVAVHVLGMCQRNSLRKGKMEN